MGSGYLEAANTYFKLAMKVQVQCRTTWEVISKIQNPPIANYAKQLNVAQNQQINNGQEIENPPNELSEGNHELLPDKRDARSPIPHDLTDQTVEVLNRAADLTWQV